MRLWKKRYRHVKDDTKGDKAMRIGDIDLGSRMERAVFKQHPDLPDTKLQPGDQLQITYTLNYNERGYAPQSVLDVYANGPRNLTRFDQERKDNICYNACSPSQPSGLHGHGALGINCPGKHKGTYPTYRAACVCDFTFHEIDGTPISYPPTPSKDKEPEYKMKQTNATARGPVAPSEFESLGHGQHATPLTYVDPFMTADRQPMVYKSDSGVVPDTQCSSAVERVLTEAAKLAQQDPGDQRITVRRLLFAIVNECRLNPDGQFNIVLSAYNKRAANMAENAVRRAFGMPEAPNEI